MLQGSAFKKNERHAVLLELHVDYQL